ncbi:MULTISPECIES: hypothetical protein [unclassified Beijerinckia]|uniref:hypothetical protein n=1 Tax=unclassified Beijerinckia TaxID=2638183 RepID=UPI0014801A43|nr:MULTISPECIES: hypothetical protein [unclassified Beijerinckia]MDH7799577.1 hypothetical protein [Beijerinckia sp. GAS462]
MKQPSGPSTQDGWWHMPLAALVVAAIVLCLDGDRLAALVTTIASLVLWVVALLE